MRPLPAADDGPAAPRQIPMQPIRLTLLCLAACLAACAAPTPPVVISTPRPPAPARASVPPPAEVVATPQAPSIYFSPGDAEVPPAAAPLLDQMAEELRGDRLRRLVLRAHTDHMGSKEYCLALSEKWASLVEAALVRRGVRGTQILIRARGRELAPACDSEACRGSWRRVEMVLQP